MWLVVSSLSPHNPYFLFLWRLLYFRFNILVFMALFCAAIRRYSVSFNVLVLLLLLLLSLKCNSEGLKVWIKWDSKSQSDNCARARTADDKSDINNARLPDKAKYLHNERFFFLFFFFLIERRYKVFVKWIINSNGFQYLIDIQVLKVDLVTERFSSQIPFIFDVSFKCNILRGF